jgi:class 3 adenylate cyclase/tetratricopeptide (TPR) repeat protein
LLLDITGIIHFSATVFTADLSGSSFFTKGNGEKLAKELGLGMICPRCQYENAANSAFCEECGAGLETVCPHCGEPNRRSAKFCRSCGQQISQTATTASMPTTVGPSPDTYVPRHLAEKILATRHILEGERKQVTVLFADIRGSTKLLEGLDPEEAQKMIDPVLRVMMEAVHRYEGTVNQVLGDGIMALFGAPLAHEDHAVRACYSALAMQEEMRRHRRRLDQSEESGLQIGIGLNSGEVVVRSIDTDLNIDYSALGHTTHLAARMQELARPGAIIVTTTTLRYVEGFVEVKPLGAVQAKGVSRAIEAYELVGATTARTRVQATAARGLTPLVGRKAEVEVFNKLVEQAALGCGQMLALVGDAGIGKSRLVHEFTRHQLPPGWLVLEGSSVSYGKATPYFPLVALLRGYFEITDGDELEKVQEKVVTQVLELDGALRDAIPPVLSLIGALPDEKTEANYLPRLQDFGDIGKRIAEMEPQQRRRYTLDAVKRVLVRESQRRPVLAVFEDLHWIDNETQAFLNGLVDSLQGVRILLVVNYRPEYRHVWGEKSYYTQLRVGPLQSTRAEELLERLLGTNKDIAPLRKLLIKRTEGNPFFAEESVRSLVETGVLVGEKGAYRPGLKIDGIHIPSTVQTLLADRIDRLPIEEKHLLQTASVLGVIVPVPLLRAVTELTEERLQVCLAHLQTAEFIYESNLFPELEYRFKHALTNEVAYGALLHSRRTALHARVANALEATTLIPSYDHIEKLAHHAYYGELWDKAVEYLKNAGDSAASRSSFRNAVLYYERGLDALRRLPESKDKQNNERRGVDLCLRTRDALFVLDDFKRGFEYLEKARRVAEALDDRERMGKALTRMTAHWNLEGNSEQALITAQQALEYTHKSNDLESNIVARNWMGIAYHNLGQFVPSIAELRKALSFISEGQKYETFGTPGIVSVNCKGWLIRGLAQIGEFAETHQLGHEAMQTAEERDHPLSTVIAHYGVGSVALIKGEFDRAIAVLGRGLNVCDSAEILAPRPLIASCLSAAHAWVGHYDEALRLLESSPDRDAWMERVPGQQLPFGKAIRMVWEVAALMLAARGTEATALARRVLDMSRDVKDRGSEAWLRYLLGDLVARWHATPSTQAEASYGKALSLAKEVGMRPLQGHCYLGLGQIHAACKNRSLARSELQAAAELYRGMSMDFWLEKADIALAAVS